MFSTERPHLLREHDIQRNTVYSEKSATVSLHEQSRDSYTTHSTYDEDQLDEFADMDEECVLGEATVMNTNEAKKRASIVSPPSLPQKSSLRASRTFDSLKFTSIESATQSFTSTHDMYLSSEEDASSSADDFSDSDDESASDESQKSPVRRKGHEDTAKVVSVVFSGKPCIVDLPRRSVSPIASDARPQTSPYELSCKAFDSRPNHPPRQSSLFSTVVPSQRPSFLNTDPYATGNYTLVEPKDEDGDCVTPQTPKIPTTTLKNIQRTFSLVRKRSRHTLQTFNGRSYGPRDSLTLTASSSTLNLLHMVSEVPSPGAEHEKSAVIATTSQTPQTPVSFHDIVRAATKAAKRSAAAQQLQQQTISPVSPMTTKKGLLERINRRRSMKG